MMEDVKVRDSWLFDRYKYKKPIADGQEPTMSLEKRVDNSNLPVTKEEHISKPEEQLKQNPDSPSEVIDSKDSKPAGIYVPDHFNRLKNYIPIEYDPLPPVEPVIKNSRVG